MQQSIRVRSKTTYKQKDAPGVDTFPIEDRIPATPSARVMKMITSATDSRIKKALLNVTEPIPRCTYLSFHHESSLKAKRQFMLRRKEREKDSQLKSQLQKSRMHSEHSVVKQKVKNSHQFMLERTLQQFVEMRPLLRTVFTNKQRQPITKPQPKREQLWSVLSIIQPNRKQQFERCVKFKEKKAIKEKLHQISLDQTARKVQQKIYGRSRNTAIQLNRTGKLGQCHAKLMRDCSHLSFATKFDLSSRLKTVEMQVQRGRSLTART